MLQLLDSDDDEDDVPPSSDEDEAPPPPATVTARAAAPATAAGGGSSKRARKKKKKKQKKKNNKQQSKDSQRDVDFESAVARAVLQELEADATNAQRVASDPRGPTIPATLLVINKGCVHNRGTAVVYHGSPDVLLLLCLGQKLEPAARDASPLWSCSGRQARIRAQWTCLAHCLWVCGA